MNPKTTDQPPQAASTTYRYSVVPPQDILLTLGEINPPERVRSPSFDPERRLMISCEDLFSGPSPRLRFCKLAELAPMDVTPELLDDDKASFPVSPSILALRFSMQTLREEIAPSTTMPEEAHEPEPPEPTDPQSENSEISPPEVSPVPPPEAINQSTSTNPAQSSPSGSTMPPSRPRVQVPRRLFSFLPKDPAAPPEQAPPSVPPPDAPTDQPQPDPIPEPEPAQGAEPTEEPPEEPQAIPEDPHTPEDPQPEPPPAPVPPPSQLNIPRQRRPLGILPMLRRKKPEPPEDAHVPQEQEQEQDAEEAVQPQESIAEHEAFEAETPPEPESPGPEEDLQANLEEDAASEDQVAPFEQEESSAAVEDESPDPARSLDVEHVTEGEPSLDLVCQEKIQEIFLTEETLTLDRVLEVCGELPGIRGCILTKGSTILGSQNIPGNIDLVSLTANAAQMLEGVKSSSMRMGLGSIPAITIHSEKGPVSFFYSGHLVMLVLHADRGFIPGVRERLHQVVQALASSPLPLRLEETEQ